MRGGVIISGPGVPDPGTDTDKLRRMSPDHSTHEPLRKALHIAFGLCAFTLKWLTWQAAAFVAVCAILGNWLVLHRLFGKRVSRDARGYDAGIVLYPAMVLLLVVVFRNRMEIAGCAWAILAFGDGFASLGGRAIGGPRLPWNRDKTWSGFATFLAFGFVGAEVVYVWLRQAPTFVSPLVIIAGSVIVAAIVESLSLNLDDNFTVPAAAAATMSLLVFAKVSPLPQTDPMLWTWLLVNTVLAVAGYLAHSVNLSGLIGGWLLGAMIIVFGGWQLYIVLLAFFVIGTGATKLGYRRKAGLGLAQEEEGRRGFTHAFSNVGVAALLALASAAIPQARTLLWLAAAASLATAAADTTASEIGQLIGRRTFLPLTFKPVPVGTEGAISWEGTIAGAVAGLCVAMIAAFAGFGRLEARLIAPITIGAILGSYLESLAGNWNRRRVRPVPNGALNFFNTAIGAVAFVLIAHRW